MVVPLNVPPINDVAHDVAKHPIGEHTIVEPNIVGALALPPAAIVKEPVIKTLPVNFWESFNKFPNIFDPLEYTIEEVTVCTLMVCAIIVPVVVKLPD